MSRNSIMSLVKKFIDIIEKKALDNNNLEELYHQLQMYERSNKTKQLKLDNTYIQEKLSQGKDQQKVVEFDIHYGIENFQYVVMKQTIFEKLAGLNFLEYFKGLKLLDMNDKVVDNNLRNLFKSNEQKKQESKIHLQLNNMKQQQCLQIPSTINRPSEYKPSHIETLYQQNLIHFKQLQTQLSINKNIFSKKARQNKQNKFKIQQSKKSKKNSLTYQVDSKSKISIENKKVNKKINKLNIQLTKVIVPVVDNKLLNKMQVGKVPLQKSIIPGMNMKRSNKLIVEKVPLEKSFMDKQFQNQIKLGNDLLKKARKIGKTSKINDLQKTNYQRNTTKQYKCLNQKRLQSNLDSRSIISSQFHENSIFNYQNKSQTQYMMASAINPTTNKISENQPKINYQLQSQKVENKSIKQQNPLGDTLSKQQNPLGDTLSQSLQHVNSIQKETKRRIQTLQNMVEMFASQCDADYVKLDQDIKKIQKSIKHVKPKQIQRPKLLLQIQNQNPKKELKKETSINWPISKNKSTKEVYKFNSIPFQKDSQEIAPITERNTCQDNRKEEIEEIHSSLLRISQQLTTLKETQKMSQKEEKCDQEDECSQQISTAEFKKFSQSQRIKRVLDSTYDKNSIIENKTCKNSKDLKQKQDPLQKQYENFYISQKKIKDILKKQLSMAQKINTNTQEKEEKSFTRKSALNQRQIDSIKKIDKTQPTSIKTTSIDEITSRYRSSIKKSTSVYQKSEKTQKEKSQDKGKDKNNKINISLKQKLFQSHQKSQNLINKSLQLMQKNILRFGLKQELTNPYESSKSKDTSINQQDQQTEEVLSQSEQQKRRSLELVNESFKIIKSNLMKQHTPKKDKQKVQKEYICCNSDQQTKLVQKQLEKKLQRLLKLIYSLNHRKQRIHYEDDKFKYKFPNKYYIYKILKYIFFATIQNESMQWNKYIQFSFLQLYREVQNIRAMEVDDLEERLVTLPPLKQPNQKTFVFDVDETLVHSNGMNSELESDIEFEIMLDKNNKGKIGFNIRPHVSEFLKTVSNHAEIIAFTASNKNYADLILNYLDPKNEIFSLRLYGNNCLQNSNKFHIKDLRILKDRDLKNIALIDNAGYSMANNLSNGIPILPFIDNKNDTELLDLQEYLLHLCQIDDIREENTKQFQLNMINRSPTVFKYLRDLFDFRK